VLPGFQIINIEDTFTNEINMRSPQHKGLVDRAVFIELKTNSLQSAQEPLCFCLRFEP
jgi:hypothetical protein